MSTKPVEFVAVEQPEQLTQVLADVVPVNVSFATRRARIKGTWMQYYGTEQYDFKDGQYYELPTDLFEYLKTRGCIYDTMI